MVVHQGIITILQEAVLLLQGRAPKEAVILHLQGHPEVLHHSAEVQEVAAVVVEVVEAVEAEVQGQVVVVDQELHRSVNFLFLF